mmetsp:Transcript_55730/g.76099  ORF Transcript_55730/g.76099 Transcript_55730/m.76099 type:complete len:201 (+) Transcript_55730:199-801(+)
MATAQVSSDALPRGTSAVAWTIENLTDIWEECKKADGCRGNEVSRLEEKLDLEGIKVHLDAGKGRRVTGKSLAEFTKRVFGEYKKLMRHRNKETVSKKITKFLNTPISFKTEGQSPETVLREGGEQIELGTGAARRLSMGEKGRLSIRHKIDFKTKKSNEEFLISGVGLAAESLFEMANPVSAAQSEVRGYNQACGRGDN